MSNSNEKITLFSNMQMWYHKHIIHFMMIFIITGLPLISHTFSWVAYIIGVPVSVFYSNVEPIYVGIQVCRVIHRITAVLWIVTSIPFVLTMLFTKWELALRKRKDEEKEKSFGTVCDWDDYSGFHYFQPAVCVPGSEPVCLSGDADFDFRGGAAPLWDRSCSAGRRMMTRRM